MLSSKCAVCDSKNSGFIKKQEAEGLLSMIGKILLLGPLININIDKNCCNSNLFVSHLLKTKKELRIIKKQEIQDTFIKTN